MLNMVRRIGIGLFCVVLVTGMGGGCKAKTIALDWVKIPAGTYQMGSGGKDAVSSEKPTHKAVIGAFQMARTETTVEQYAACVAAGKCSPAGACNTDYEDRGKHPVNCVTWDHARAFCQWAGGRLPSEAEWEYAARGGGQGQNFPWGDETASCSRAVMGDGGDVDGCGRGSTWPVCSKTTGNTPQGLCDMAGNVEEWVADCWHDDYNGAPTDGTAWTTKCGEGDDLDRILRGGSWFVDDAPSVRAAKRERSTPANLVDSHGFRCAKGP
jgi:formylglycine-generating enzyme